MLLTKKLDCVNIGKCEEHKKQEQELSSWSLKQVPHRTRFTDVLLSFTVCITHCHLSRTIVGSTFP